MSVEAEVAGVVEVPEMFKRTATGRPSSDRVLAYLLDGLLDGRINPGDRVNARKLAEQLDVSIVPCAKHYICWRARG